jgi:hypothetical protein
MHDSSWAFAEPISLSTTQTAAAGDRAWENVAIALPN